MPSPGWVGVRIKGYAARSRRGRRGKNSRRCSPVFVEPGCMRSRLWIRPSPLRTGPGLYKTWRSLLFQDFEVGCVTYCALSSRRKFCDGTRLHPLAPCHSHTARKQEIHEYVAFGSHICQRLHSLTTDFEGSPCLLRISPSFSLTI